MAQAAQSFSETFSRLLFSHRSINMSYPLTLIMLLLWGEPSGTLVPYCVDQPRETESFVGENLTLPCKFVYPEKKETVSGVNIIWKAYDGLFCGYTTKEEIYNSLTNVSVSKYHGRLLLRGDPLAENVSLILNNVTLNDTNRYCCRVIISFKGKEKTPFQSVDGTSLTVRERTNTFKIIQPQETVFQKSAIINCSFTMPQYSNILRTEVYWMIGDPREDYVYHPNPDYIHPHYKGKTRLVDGSNLLLQDFHGLNNTIFYCRVMIQRCPTISRLFTRTDITMEEGPGTLLTSENVNGPSEGVTTLPLCLQSIIIVACSVLKFILLIALFILALVYIKKS